MVRDTKTAVNMLARMPMDRVTAKPLTGPVPNWKRKSAAIRVVMFASRIVPKARANPVSMAARTVLPTFSSSRMRSKISTLASTAMPMVRITPAMPGRVRVAPK